MAFHSRSNPAPARQWPEQGQWTYDDWLELPEDGTRYEVIDGVLYMTPPPSTAHQIASHRLATLMTTYIDTNLSGIVITAPVGVCLPGQPVPLQPDIIYISAARKGIIGSQYVEGAPDLVVEILSPSNWPYDRQEKFQVYRQAGIPEYWIVDYRQRTIEVFALDREEYLLLGKWGTGEQAASRLLAGFQAPVAEVFKDL